MRQIITIFIILLFTLGENIAFSAGNPNLVKNFINPKEWCFVENKGQLAPTLKGDVGLSPLHGVGGDVKYYNHSGGAQVYCYLGKISFVFTKTENEERNISEATGNSLGFPLPKGAGGFGEKNKIK